MTTEGVNLFQTDLEARFTQLGLESAHTEAGPDAIGDILRVLIPVTDEGDLILTEIVFTPWADDCDLLHLYSTLIAEIGPGYETLKEQLIDWNLACPLGAFGIFRERQFYHKYDVPLPPDADPKALAEKAFKLINLIAAAAASRFPEAVQISEMAPGQA